MKRRKLFQSLLPIVLLIATLASCGQGTAKPVQTTLPEATSGTTAATTVRTTADTTSASVADTSSSVQTTAQTTQEPWPEYVNGEVTPYLDGMENYSLEQADEENCIIHVDLDIVSGQEVWNSFIDKTELGIPASVRVIWYYNKSEMFEKEILKGYDLMFNGESYVLDVWNTEEGFVMRRYFLYLLEFDDVGDAFPYAEWVNRHDFMLANSKSYTHPQAVSSSYLDTSALVQIYSDLIY